MQKLQLQLPNPIASITSLHRVSFVEIPDDDSFGDEPPQPDLILETVSQISGQLSRIQQTVTQQNSQVQATAAAYATEMVRMLMQGDNEILIARVNRYIDLAMNESEDGTRISVFVHPSLLDPVSEHLSGKVAGSLRIEAEATLAKEDCRVEFQDSGLIASLEHQMDIVTSRLGDAIASGGAF